MTTKTSTPRTSTTTRTAVVTGATSGLGQAAAIALAARGYRVLIVGRDQVRGQATVSTIRGAGGQAELVLGDLMTIAGAEAVAAEILRIAPSIDLLINNAGGAFGRDERTDDGLERTFALNVLAPFILTEALIEPLAAARGRVVNVVTAVPNGAKTTIDAIAGEKASAGMGSYVRNKLALLTLTIEEQRRFEARGVSFVSLHPGVIPGTRFGSDSPGIFMKIGPVIARLIGITSTLDEAAERFVHVGSDEVVGGGFYYEGKLRPAPRQAQDPAFAAELRSALAGMVA
ncbi:MAG: SDR family NAD(P)-dependent oxidoreductase [Myxococcales bacterium]|nr:SDR family NAD(P)-dependent oxidoreductase [Myxococcales bacterium]